MANNTFVGFPHGQGGTGISAKPTLFEKYKQKHHGTGKATTL